MINMFVSIQCDACSGLDLIVRERARQETEEGWSEEHDDEHLDKSLAWAAACYAAPEAIHRSALEYVGKDPADSSKSVFSHNYKQAWPWDPKWDKRDKHSRRRQLVIAGALILAELDRLDRLEDEEKKK